MLKLQVVFLLTQWHPALAAGALATSSASYLATRPVPSRKLLHLTDASKTLMQVCDDVVRRYTRLYPEDDKLEIVQLQDANLCDLDPEYIVGDVFSSGDVMQVVVDNDLDVSTVLPDDPAGKQLQFYVTPSVLRLQEQLQSTPIGPPAPVLSRKRQLADFFDTFNLNIPKKPRASIWLLRELQVAPDTSSMPALDVQRKRPLQSRSVTSPQQAPPSHSSPWRDAFDESNISLPPPEEDTTLLDSANIIPQKKQPAPPSADLLTSPGGIEAKRVTSGMLSVPLHTQMDNDMKDLAQVTTSVSRAPISDSSDDISEDEVASQPRPSNPLEPVSEPPAKPKRGRPRKKPLEAPVAPPPAAAPAAVEEADVDTMTKEEIMGLFKNGMRIPAHLRNRLAKKDLKGVLKGVLKSLAIDMNDEGRITEAANAKAELEIRKNKRAAALRVAQKLAAKAPRKRNLSASSLLRASEKTDSSESRDANERIATKSDFTQNSQQEAPLQPKETYVATGLSAGPGGSEGPVAVAPAVQSKGQIPKLSSQAVPNGNAILTEPASDSAKRSKLSEIFDKMKSFDDKLSSHLASVDSSVAMEGIETATTSLKAVRNSNESLDSQPSAQNGTAKILPKLASTKARASDGVDSEMVDVSTSSKQHPEPTMDSMSVDNSLIADSTNISLSQVPLDKLSMSNKSVAEADTPTVPTSKPLSVLERARLDLKKRQESARRSSVSSSGGASSPKGDSSQASSVATPKSSKRQPKDEKTVAKATPASAKKQATEQERVKRRNEQLRLAKEALEKAKSGYVEGLIDNGVKATARPSQAVPVKQNIASSDEPTATVKPPQAAKSQDPSKASESPLQAQPELTSKEQTLSSTSSKAGHSVNVKPPITSTSASASASSSDSSDADSDSSSDSSDLDSGSESDHGTAKKKQPRVVAVPSSTVIKKPVATTAKPAPPFEAKQEKPNAITNAAPKHIHAKREVTKPSDGPKVQRMPTLTSLSDLALRGLPDVKDSDPHKQAPSQAQPVVKLPVKPITKSSTSPESSSSSESSTSSSSSDSDSDGDSESSSESADDRYINIKKLNKEKPKKKGGFFDLMKDVKKN